MRANELKPGMAVNLDGKLYVCVKTDHVKPGKGPAYVQAKLRGVDGSGMAERRFNTDAVIDGATLDRREMEYLYSDASGATFMDTDDYEQHIIPENVLGDSLLFVRPNASCTILFSDGTPVSLELPSAVDLVIADTPPGIKGATATNQMKEATCDTGLKTKVPPFIVTGETIRVSTDDGSYISRVKAE
ncbi:MAG: elongation factor P [Phycisphaerales bacterium]|nr:elongation factor P [Phycisphaerales bacterium]MCB9835615.1 elongation factor P [Phycisphaera sp.]